jgi:hypothetical protein
MVKTTSLVVQCVFFFKWVARQWVMELVEKLCNILFSFQAEKNMISRVRRFLVIVRSFKLNIYNIYIYIYKNNQNGLPPLVQVTSQYQVQYTIYLGYPPIGNFHVAMEDHHSQEVNHLYRNG